MKSAAVSSGTVTIIDEAFMIVPTFVILERLFDAPDKFTIII